MFTSIINAKDLFDILGQSNLVIIDCRFVLNDSEAGRRSYLESHIPGAYYAHLDKDLSGPVIPGKTGRHPFPSIEEFAEKCGNWGIEDDVQVVVYDQNHGGIAARLWYLLKWLGHEKVAVLNGGWDHWVKMGYPVTQNIPKPAGKTFHPKKKNKWLVSAEEVNNNPSNENYKLFDSRTADRYRGENETIDPIAGHIPGAASAPYVDNVNDEGLFLEKEKLVERFDKLLGDKNADEAVFYCGSGVTACHNLLALSYIGKEGAKLYPGSWSEWITDENRPIETGG